MSWHVTTICGSMRYYPTMLAVAGELTRLGEIVLMPYLAVEEGTGTKAMLDEMHREKIRMSKSIMVVGTHIGDSTSAEIQYAARIGVPVRYWKDRPLVVTP